MHAPAAQAVPGDPHGQPLAGLRISRAHSRHNLIEVTHRARIEAPVYMNGPPSCTWQ